MLTVSAPPKGIRAQPPRKFLRRALLVCVALVSVGFVALCNGDERPRSEVPVLRLRVAWGGGEATKWQGSLYVHRGRIIEKRSLGIEDDAPGSMWLDGGRLHVRQKTARQYDGVDIAIVAPLESTLVVALHSVESDSPKQTMEIKLSDLVTDRYSRELGPTNLGNRLLVHRTPGDRLRIRTLTQSLVFAPGEQLQLELRPHLLGAVEGDNIQLNSKIVRARSDEIFSSQQQALTMPAKEEAIGPISLEYAVPQEEGVYDLVLTAARLRSAFSSTIPFRNRRDVLAQRRVQFIVLSKTPQGKNTLLPVPPPEKLVMEINPSNPWWKRVTQMSALPGFGGGPLKEGKVTLWKHPQLGKFQQLAPAKTDEEISWVAYPLAVNEPGQVHILEVEYPTDVPQAMGISLLEADAAGEILPIGIDSGVIVDEQSQTQRTDTAKHRLAFWPKTKEPVLLITNSHQERPAVHGRIRLFGPKMVGISALRWGGSHSSRLPQLVPEGTPDGGRLFAAYMARPLIPENFSATDMLDEATGRSMDDWVTFYEAGRRLIEYLQYAGHNAVIMSVLARGSTIYPSELLSPTPRYDSGIFFSTGQDPIRKDVLEMLLRMCDRANIRFIPALQFQSPLPELEQIIRDGGKKATGIELIDVRGMPWTENSDGVANGRSRYNPLHADVQQAVFNTVREVLDRYHQHHSLAGVAIDSSGQGCTLLPGADWGYDVATRSRFAREAGIEINTLRPSQVASPQQSSRIGHHAAWLEWRAEKIWDFHDRLAREIRNTVPDGKLYVATTAMQRSPELGSLLRPALPTNASVEELLLAVGIAPEKYANHEDGIVLLRSRIVASDFSSIDPAAARQIDASLELDRRLSAVSKLGYLLQTHPRELRLPSFDAKSPFGAEFTHTRIAPHLVPSDSMNRQLLVKSLAAADSDILAIGGWMLTLGQEASLRSLVSAYRQLPVGNYETISGEHEPIVLRKLSVNGKTFAYLINQSDWKCDVALRLTTDHGVAIEDLSGDKDFPKTVQGHFRVPLDRYDFVALKFDGDDVDFGNVTVTFNQDVRGVLQQRINDLADRTIELKQPRNIDALKNPSFELPESEGHIQGWKLKGGAGTSTRIDREEKKSGTAALCLQSEGNAATFVSNRFPPPRTGRLAFSVWLKTSRDFSGSLKLAISGRHLDREIYRFGMIPKSADWQLFDYQIDDLPVADLSDLQVRFEFTGNGKVWIDKIAVSELHFSDNERKELSRILTQAHVALTSGKLSECERILDGYWPCFLKQHVPLPGQLIASAPETIRQAELPRLEKVAPEADKGEEKSSWWKKKLPAFLR